MSPGQGGSRTQPIPRPILLPRKPRRRRRPPAAPAGPTTSNPAPSTNQIAGTDGPDVTIGSDQSDSISLLAGNDVAIPKLGDDFVEGGARWEDGPLRLPSGSSCTTTPSVVGADLATDLTRNHRREDALNRIIINGVTYEGVRSVSVVNGVVTIDGKRQDSTVSGVVEVRVLDGVLGELRTDASVTCGEVRGNVHAGGSVKCAGVGGSISAGGSVRCASVDGSINAGGSVRHT